MVLRKERPPTDAMLDNVALFMRHNPIREQPDRHERAVEIEKRGIVRANRLETFLASGDAQFLPLFQRFARDDPLRGDAPHRS